MLQNFFKTLGFLVGYNSIFIRAKSVDPHGIRHTAAFIMIVTFHQDTCLSDPSESWNSIQSLKAVLVFISGHTMQTHMECGYRQITYGSSFSVKI